MSRARMTRWLVIAIAMALSRPALAQCPGGVCPVPPRSQSGAGHYTQPPPYVCRLKNQIGAMACCGTGTLVCVGSDYGAVITCAHLFRDGSGRVTAIFPGGTYTGKLAAKDVAGDLAIVRLDKRPEIPVCKIATDYPRQGERVTFGGYGQSGQYREMTGTINGYRETSGGRAQTLEMRGAARQGDSGGPIFNARRELVAVLWGTDGSRVVGSYNGRICEFTASERFLFPWNADLAREKYRHEHGQQPPSPIETLPPAPGQQDDIPDTDLAAIGQEVTALRQDVDELKKIADAATKAAAKAETEAGKAFAEAVGAKTDAQDAHTVTSQIETLARDAAAKADDAAGAAEDLKAGLMDRITTRAKEIAVGVLTKYGGWSLGLAGAVVGLLVWLVRKDILDKIRNGDPLLIEKLAAHTGNKLDDRIAGLVASRIEAHADPSHGLREELRDIRDMLTGRWHAQAEPDDDDEAPAPKPRRKRTTTTRRKAR